MRNRQILHRHLLYTGWYLKMIGFAQKIRLRKGRASLYRTLIIFMDNVSDNQVLERANGVAFSFTLSAFPGIIFLFALIPFLHHWIPSISQAEILHFLKDIMPQGVFKATSDTITDTIAIRREGLISFGVLFAFYLATNGVNSLMKAFNASYKTVERRSFIRTRLTSLYLTIILAFTLILAILLLVVGQQVIDFLIGFGILAVDYIYYILLALRFAVVFITFYLALASIYYWGPAIHTRWRFFSVGSIFASLAAVGVSFAFSYYINNFGTYNKVYGSIGTLIAFMIWQYLMSAIILLGFELNASVDRACNDEAPESK